MIPKVNSGLEAIAYNLKYWITLVKIFVKHGKKIWCLFLHNTFVLCVQVFEKQHYAASSINLYLNS